MEERQLVIDGFYQHFKGKLYQVRGIAYHSETSEKMVVYQALYGDYAMYVRPFEQFMSEVEHSKYPEVTQKYRFVQVHIGGNHDDKPNAEAAGKSERVLEQRVSQEINEELEQQEFEDGLVDARLLQFLDAETYNEKLNVLTYLRSGLDDKIIDAMGASMDAEIPAGSVEERYRSLRSVIMTHCKYECTRLRE